jgi:hypothetical protein
MNIPSDEVQHISSKLEDGTIIGIETIPSSVKGLAEITSDMEHPFVDITNSIESIAHAVLTTLRKVKPRKASVEFGIEVAAQEGRLFAVVVRGDGKANMKITLEWGEDSASLPNEQEASD